MGSVVPIPIELPLLNKLLLFVIQLVPFQYGVFPVAAPAFKRLDVPVDPKRPVGHAAPLVPVGPVQRLNLMPWSSTISRVQSVRHPE